MPVDWGLHMSPEPDAPLDVSLGVSELLPPLVVSCAAQPAYQSPDLTPDHLAVLSRLTGLYLTDRGVVLTAGASQGLLAAHLFAMRNLPARPQKIVTFAPHYPGYRALSDLLGLPLVCLPISLSEEPDELAREIAGHGGAIWLVNSPHNPTGSELGPDVLGDMAARVARAGGQLIWDAAYLGVTNRPGPIAAIPPDLIVVGSFSKLFGMAGERIGFVTGPAQDLPGLARAQWGLALNAPASGVSMVQARLETLTDSHMRASHQAIAANRIEIQQALVAYGATSLARNGPFFWCPPFAGSTPLINRLAQKNIAVAPGGPFGAEETAFRINLMVARHKTQELVRRLAQ